jgi:hypothetical protein
MNKNTIELSIGLILSLIGSYLVITNSSWMMFLGIFLLFWANNISTRY